MKKGNVLSITTIVFIIISLCISAYILFQQSLRLDEAQSLWAAAKSVPGIIEFISTDVHVPLYHLILHFWLQIFGNNILSARVLSFIFFLASIFFLYAIAKKSGNKTIALLTILLYSLSPFIAWYSFEARMYTLFLLAVCASHYFFLKMVRSSGKKGQVGYFFSLFFGLYTHYFFILLILTQIFFYSLEFVKRYKDINSVTESIRIHRREIFNFLTPLILAGLLFLPWIIYFKIQGAASNTQPLIPPASVNNLFQLMASFLFGFQSNKLEAFIIALWPLSVIPVFFLFSRRKTKVLVDDILYFSLTVFIPVFLVFFISYLRPIFLIRYLIFVVPSFFILLSWVLFQLSKQLSASILVIFTLIMFGALLFQNISNSTPVKENYEEVTAYLNKNASTDDIIAISSPFTIYPIEYYYKGSAVITTIPYWNRYTAGNIPSYTTSNLVKQVKDYEKTYQNIYVVLSYDQGYEDDIKKYMENNYQRVYIKNFSPGLELREYKLRY